MSRRFSETRPGDLATDSVGKTSARMNGWRSVLLRRRLRGSRLDERERRLLLHRATRLGGDRDEVVLVERVDLVAAAHRERVGALQGLALERHAELGEPRREPAPA